MIFLILFVSFCFVCFFLLRVDVLIDEWMKHTLAYFDTDKGETTITYRANKVDERQLCFVS